MQNLNLQDLIKYMKACLKIYNSENIGVKYKKPIKLARALIGIQQESNMRCINPVDRICDTFVKNVGKNKELAKMRVSGYVGRGTSAMVFETPDGNILKLTNRNHFPLNRPHQSFDVPVYKKGKAGNTFYYVEEKLFQHGMNEGFVSVMRDMIKKAGFKPYDMYDGDYFQLGLSRDGKLYLLDSECARYKTIFHALWDKVKKLCKSK